jgi:hypothetical protein
MPSIIGMIKSKNTRTGHVARMGEKRNTYRKPEGKRQHRWVDNVKMDLGEIGWGGIYWIGVIQDRDKWRALVNAVMNVWVP